MAAPYLHVDIIQARNLIPGDINKVNGIAVYSSDAFAKLRLWPRAGEKVNTADSAPELSYKDIQDDAPTCMVHSANAIGQLTTNVLSAVGIPVPMPDAKEQGDELTTQVVKKSLDPKWQRCFTFKDVPSTVRGVEIEVWDWDMFDPDDYLGAVIILLPGQGADGAGAKSTERVVYGWFPLQFPAQMLPQLKRMLAEKGRDPEKFQPPALGEVLVRISYGNEPKPMSVLPMYRPSLRPSIGQLRLRVLKASGLKPRDRNSRYHVIVKFEQRECSTGSIAATDPNFSEGNSFTFRVTEITSDAVFTIMQDKKPFAEAVVPLASLIKQSSSKDDFLRPPAFRTGHIWVKALPVRDAHSTYLQPVKRPTNELGTLMVDVSLMLSQPLAFCYLAPQVLPPRLNSEGLADGDPTKASLASVKAAAGRAMDALLAPSLAPLRAVCYLQTWQKPHLNVVLLSLLSFSCHSYHMWRIAVHAWPAVIAGVVPIIGYITFCIHENDKTPMYVEELSSEHRAQKLAEQEKADAAKMHEKMEYLAKKEQGMAADDPSQNKGGMDVFEMWRYINEKMAGFEGKFTSLAVMIERMEYAYTWEDPAMSRLVFALHVGVFLAISIVHRVIMGVFAVLPLYFRHYVWILGCLVFAPVPQVTYMVLDGIDQTLQLYAPVPLSSITAGSGLAVAKPKGRGSSTGTGGRLATENYEGPSMSLASMQRQIDEQVRTERLREVRALEELSQVQKVTLLAPPLQLLGQLLGRAPTLERARHARIARRTVQASPRQ